MLCIQERFSSSFGGDGNGATAWFMKVFKPFFRTPEQAATGIVHMATARELNDVTGQYFADGKPARSSPKAKSRALARELWAFSEALTETVLI